MDKSDPNSSELMYQHLPVNKSKQHNYQPINGRENELSRDDGHESTLTPIRTASVRS